MSWPTRREASSCAVSDTTEARKFVGIRKIRDFPIWEGDRVVSSRFRGHPDTHCLSSMRTKQACAEVTHPRWVFSRPRGRTKKIEKVKSLPARRDAREKRGGWCEGDELAYKKRGLVLRWHLTRQKLAQYALPILYALRRRLKS